MKKFSLGKDPWFDFLALQRTRGRPSGNSREVALAIRPVSSPESGCQVCRDNWWKFFVEGEVLSGDGWLAMQAGGTELQNVLHWEQPRAKLILYIQPVRTIGTSQGWWLILYQELETASKPQVPVSFSAHWISVFPSVPLLATVKDTQSAPTCLTLRTHPAP